MSLSRKAYQGFSWNATATILSIVLSIIQIYILVRLLEVDAFGIMAILVFTVSYALILSDYGFENSIIQQEAVSKSERSSLFWLILIAGIILSLIIALLAQPIANLFENDDIAMPLLLISTVVFINSIGRLHKILFYKALAFKFIAIVEIIALIISFVITIYLAYNDYGVYSLVIGYMSKIATESICYFINGSTQFSIGFSFSNSHFKNFFQLGKYELGLKFSGELLRKIDILMVGKFLNTNILGNYEVVKNFTAKPHGMVPGIFTEISYPLYAQLKNKAKQITRLYATQLKIIYFFLAPLYVFLFMFAEPIIEFYLGQEWIHMKLTFLLFVAVFFIRTSGNPIGGLLMALGQIKFLFFWNIVALLITLLAVALTISNGIEAVAFGLLIVQLIYIFPTYFLVVKKHTLLNFFAYLKIILFSLIIAIVAFGVLRVIPINGNSLVILTAQFLIGMFIYIVIYLSIDKDFKELLINYMSNKRNESPSL